ncbi:MAG: hypothetical protein H7A46_00225 [Verrucomicrobiales bacterium]|nr:hypothetical protein [Verrucomicrobiales bacterium]
MNPDPPPRRPPIPTLIIGAIALLLLSWVVFMGYYIARERYKQRIHQPPPITIDTNHTTTGP